MPIYEYQCKACGHKFESLQKISDPPHTDCPDCEKPELIKLISAAGFRLKGSGWYETDFKGGDKKKNIAGDQPADKKSTSKESKKESGKAKKTPAPASK